MAHEAPLEFGEIFHVLRGALNPGRLRIQPDKVTFKSGRTGKLDQYTPPEIDEVQWLRGAKGWEMKLVLVNGNTFRLQGFKESDGDKLSGKVKKWFGTEWNIVERSVAGHNYGNASFEGSSLSLKMDGKPSFMLPLQDVSHTTTNKNEVTLEFHQNDEAPIQLVEMRFFVPSGNGELEDMDPVKDFHEKVMAKADIIQATGDAIVTFNEVACLTPRGRYSIKLFPNYVALHGKTYNFTVPFGSIVRLFLLPHTDQRQMFYVVYMDPPMRQGQTRYPFLIFLFQKEDSMETELALSEEELEQYAGKLTKNLSGPVYEVLSRVMKAVTGRRIIVPGTFKSHRGGNGISCSYRANHGLLYPLEKSFIFVHKPALLVRLDEVTGVNFARGNTGPSRSFDFEVSMKSGQTHTFMGMDKNEYGVLYDFVSTKKLHIRNTGGKPGAKSYREDFDDEDSDEQDAYLRQMKLEGAARADDTDSDDSSYVADSGDDSAEDIEFDSDASLSGDEDGGDEETRKPKPEKRKSSNKDKEKPKAKRTKEDSGSSKKAKKDPNAPKRPMSAYMLWMNANRERIKKENPGSSIGEISKKAGEQWKTLTSSKKEVWQQKAKEAKAKYEVEMKAYKASVGGTSASSSSKPTKAASKSPKKAANSTKFKSAEEVNSSDDDSDVSLKNEDLEDDDSEEEKPKKVEKTATRSTRSRRGGTEELTALPSEGSSEEEEELSTSDEDDDDESDD